MKRNVLFSYLIFLSIFPSIYALKLDRVIIACDLHREYIDFWPLVAKSWQEIVGLRPTLALIAPEYIYVDESVGDVIRFDPIPGIPTHMQAQVIRLLLPALYPDDGCIISDMDIIPCSKNYFVDSIKNVSDNCFVVYRDQAYGTNPEHYPMCYLAAQGKVFAELFGVTCASDFAPKIKQWYEQNLGWHTDQLILFNTLAQWPQASKRCVKLGHGVTGRIDRGYFHYDRQLLKAGFYIDSHLPKPYLHYAQAVDQLAQDLGISHTYDRSVALPQVKRQHIQQACTYLTPLLIALKNTNGPVIELGTDDQASEWLHEFCGYEKRFLATCETDIIRLSFFSHLISNDHLLWLIMTPGESQERYPTLDKWDNVYHTKHWSVAVINHVPRTRRVDDILKMRSHTNVFIVPVSDDSVFELTKIFAHHYCYDRYDQKVLLLSDKQNVAAWFAKK